MDIRILRRETKLFLYDKKRYVRYFMKRRFSYQIQKSNAHTCQTNEQLSYSLLILRRSNY